MSHKFDIFFSLNSPNLTIAVFDNKTKNNILLQSLDLSTKPQDFIGTDELNKIIENKIFEIEKITKQFLNEIYIMIEASHINSIGLSISKDNEGKIIQKKDILYLVQDARQQIIRAYKKYTIAHILIDKYLLDKNQYDNLPDKTNCKNFSLDISFICIPNFLIKEIENVFKGHHIKVKKFLCSTYAKSISPNSNNVCQAGYNLINGINKKEVELIPRKVEKEGFFERLFHIFN